MPSVAGKRGDTGRALGVLIVTPDNNDLLLIPTSDGEDSGGGVVVGDGRFRDGPGAPRVGRAENTGRRAASV